VCNLRLQFHNLKFYIYIYIYMYVCVCVCVYIYIYIGCLVFGVQSLELHWTTFFNFWRIGRLLFFFLNIVPKNNISHREVWKKKIVFFYNTYIKFHIYFSSSIDSVQ